jgi:hypothetical protein
MARLAIKVPLYLILLLVVLNGLTLGIGALTYNRLADEAMVAQLRFEQLGDQHYRVHLISLDVPGVGHSYEIRGDQWQLDAEFMKIKPWANILGVDALYRLDRLQGRYRDINQQNASVLVAYELSPRQGNWLSRFMGSWDWLVLVADAEYGSATYASIETDKIYSVYRTQSGLITRIAP